MTWSETSSLRSDDPLVLTRLISLSHLLLRRDNFYTQVVGHKRFLMFPPSNFWALYLFPPAHPASRASQVNFNDPRQQQHFPEFRCENLQPLEGVLDTGDTLFIPSMWFHYVAVAGDGVSISISETDHRRYAFPR